MTCDCSIRDVDNWTESLILVVNKSNQQLPILLTIHTNLLITTHMVYTMMMKECNDNFEHKMGTKALKGLVISRVYNG